MSLRNTGCATRTVCAYLLLLLLVVTQRGSYARLLGLVTGGDGGGTTQQTLLRSPSTTGTEMTTASPKCDPAYVANLKEFLISQLSPNCLSSSTLTIARIQLFQTFVEWCEDSPSYLSTPMVIELCPGYEVQVTDLDPTNIDVVTDVLPIYIFRDNLTLKCGPDGSSVHSCKISSNPVRKAWQQVRNNHWKPRLKFFSLV